MPLAILNVPPFSIHGNILTGDSSGSMFLGALNKPREQGAAWLPDTASNGEIVAAIDSIIQLSCARTRATSYALHQRKQAVEPVGAERKYLH